MTVREFEDFLIQTRVQLNDAFKNTQNIQDLDVYIKTVLDYQEIVSKTMFKELSELRKDILNARGDLLKDNRERFEKIMNKLSE